ncbi:hypothetical protein A4A49_19994 [Nicotiana attenuata]|uniref:Uncharacterized protein n=1 Tax=Nicotiana attenuata TaxID=49451 RepID=A0A1J6JBK8_NICAT|nr:hypothetical protein A4A49_19994 [Nicotiana attenuata]
MLLILLLALCRFVMPYKKMWLLWISSVANETPVHMMEAAAIQWNLQSRYLHFLIPIWLQSWFVLACVLYYHFSVVLVCLHTHSDDDTAVAKDGNKDVTKGDNVHVKSKDIPAATVFARMYTATVGALKVTADRTDVVNKCDTVQQQVPASGNVKEMQNQQVVKEVAGLPNNETPNRNQSSTAQTGKSKDARQSANSQGHLNLQHTTREKEKEAGVYDSKNQEQVKLTKEAEITHETGAHNNARGNFVAGVQTVSLEATVMDVDDHTYGGKLTKDDGGTKHTVGDDWKVVRFSGRQGASPGVKYKQQQMSFPDKKDEN